MIDFFFLIIALITNNYIPVTFSLLSFHVISSEISAFNKEFYIFIELEDEFFSNYSVNHVIFLHPLYIVLISIHRKDSKEVAGLFSHIHLTTAFSEGSLK